MSGSSVALPIEWAERLFSRFQAIYGNKTATMWGRADPREVQSTWAEELGRYGAEDLRMALAACRFAYKEYPPTLFQFADLCLDAKRRREASVPKIELKPDPDGRAKIAAAVHELAQNMRNGKRDPKDWARRILQKHESGIHVHQIALEGAREALGL